MNNENESQNDTKENGDNENENESVDNEVSTAPAKNVRAKAGSGKKWDKLADSKAKRKTLDVKKGK